MAKKDVEIRALCKSLGKEYRICTIDFERVIYRDFGNGFNVEISGVYTKKEKKNATLYLWHGDTQPECLVVKTVRDVPRESISGEVEQLLHYSNSLLADGLDTRDKLFDHKYKIFNCAKGEIGMMRKLFYGPETKISDGDRHYFSRGNYECKKLLRNQKGQLVVISQCQDKDLPIWKLEYGFSCVMFGSLEDVLGFCKGKFTDLDGKEV